MSKHTPGPWVANTDAHGRGRVYSAGNWLATTWLATGDGNDAPQLPALANAHLIAAAPEMLETLKRLRKMCADFGAKTACDMADAAILKATGEQA
jgi:hypothetical protein